MDQEKDKTFCQKNCEILLDKFGDLVNRCLQRFKKNDIKPSLAVTSLLFVTDRIVSHNLMHLYHSLPDDLPKNRKMAMMDKYISVFKEHLFEMIEDQEAVKH